MIADIYYENDGGIECDDMVFYPDLRYCRRELEGNKRLLKYVSLYKQEKLCLCSLLKIQKYLTLHSEISKLKNDHSLKYQLGQIEDKLLKI